MIGIVASRIAERHHRPAILIALDGEEGSGSGRSIPRFDLLGGLQRRAAAPAPPRRPQGGRGPDDRRATRSRRSAPPSSSTPNEVLTEEDLRPEVRIDAVAQGDALSLDLAEELQQLAPFGAGNPPVSLLVPSAHLIDPQPMSEGRHVRFTLSAGGAKSRCVAFGNGGTLPVAPDEPADAAVRLEIDRWNGAVSPKLVLRRAQRCGPGPIEVRRRGRVRARRAAASSSATSRSRRHRTPAPSAPHHARPARHRDRRLLGDLVATGEPVLAVTAHAPHRARVLADRVGGFALTSWAALEDDPELAEPLRPRGRHRPADSTRSVLSGEGWTHLAWGTSELDFALRIHEWDFALRDPLTAVYRALRASRAEQR